MTRSLTEREKLILRTWWQTRGSSKATAALLGVRPQSIRNQLYLMRRTHGASTNLGLFMMFEQEVR